MQKIMIIDDDPALRKALSIRLAASGFDVRTAEHPDAAARLVMRDPPHLILLDIDMPRISGLEFHHCLQLTNRARNIPVIYLSGAGSHANRQAAFRQGARAFFDKPFEHSELLDTIRGVLESQDAA